MKTTTRKAKKNAKTRKTPVTIRRTATGYRINTRKDRFTYHNEAFEAAWADARRQYRDLVAISPKGERIPLLGAAAIRAYGK